MINLLKEIITEKEEMPKILFIADTNNISRSLLSIYLTSKGFDIITSEDAIDVINKIQDNNVNLVLLDMNLLDDKIENLILTLKKITPKLPIIVISESISIENIQKIKTYDISFYIVKPFDFNEIIMIIDDILNIKKVNNFVNK